jgi:hypothetical protein
MSSGGLFYLSFHGGSGSGSLNNIHIYASSGKDASPPKLLPAGDPPLSELRSFAFTPNGLFVVNGYKKYSQLLQYVLNGSAYQYSTTWADPTINSVDHPFDFTFDPSGQHCYLSSQDTGVVTILTGAGQTGAVPAALTANDVPASSYLQGTFVASISDNLPNITNASVGVAEPLGLAVEVANGKMSNSVRGLAYWNGALLVADEVAGMVKAYSTTDGSLLAAVTGLDSPVHLLINGTTLYISTGQGAMQVALPSQISFTTPLNAEPYIDETMLSSGGAKSVAGMCFAPEPKSNDQVMYFADRKGNAVYYLDTSNKLQSFLTKLSDSPEFIVYQS